MNKEIQQLSEAYVSIYESKLDALKSFSGAERNVQDLIDLFAPYKGCAELNIRVVEWYSVPSIHDFNKKHCIGPEKTDMGWVWHDMDWVRFVDIREAVYYVLHKRNAQHYFINCSFYDPRGMWMTLIIYYNAEKGAWDSYSQPWKCPSSPEETNI